MRLPQSVKRSISSRVLCLGSVAPRGSSSSSLASEGSACSHSDGGVGGRPAGAAGEAGSDGRESKSVLGVGWLVTEEEGDNSGGLQVLAVICFALESPVKNRGRSSITYG